MAKQMIFDHRDLYVSIDCRATPMCHARLNFAMYPATSPKQFENPMLRNGLLPKLVHKKRC